MRASAPIALLLLGLAVAAAPAQATWSVVAVDEERGEVGVAGASCIEGTQVIVGLAPGHGAVAAQALANTAGRDRVAARLAAGVGPDAALAEVAGAAFDSGWGIPFYRLRQYGAVALGFRTSAANFTGAWTIGWAGAASGPGVSVQGNMLRGPEVVDAALAAFNANAPADCRRTLSDRLMDALEAGARAGGDKRCVAELSAISAVLAVARRDDAASAPHLYLARTRPGETPSTAAMIWNEIRRGWIEPESGTREENPVTLLRAAYEEWRAERGVPACR